MATRKELLTTNVGFSDGKKHYLSGNGLPGSSAETDDAPKGSEYTDLETGIKHHKETAGAGADKWVASPTKRDLDAVVNGVSWREPVTVLDSASTTVAEAEATLESTGSLDGVTIEDGDRVLLSALSAESKNVYIATGGGASWTLTEDPDNTATAGDTVYIEGGTEGGSRFTYNGANWVATDKQSRDELGYIRAFIGKDAGGSEGATFTSTNHIANGDSLEAALGKIDAELGANISAGQTRTVGQVVDTSVGANVLALDSAIGADPTSVLNIGSNKTINENLSTLDAVLGNRPADANYIANANTVGQNLSALDTAVADQMARYSAENVTAKTVIGQASVAATVCTKWLVEVTYGSDVTRRKFVEISAAHNGNSLTLATDVQSVITSDITVGTPIAGLDISVELTGADPSTQTLDLTVTAPAAVNVKALRLKV